MPNCDPWDRFFYQYLTLMQDSYILAHQIVKADVLTCVRNLLSYTSYLTQGTRIVTVNIGCIVRHVIS